MSNYIMMHNNTSGCKKIINCGSDNPHIITDNCCYNVNKTIFVDIGRGDNTTGDPYHPDKPFENISNAVSVALNDDVIFVRPGIYNVNNLLNNIPVGVTKLNFYFQEGSIIK